jgi:Na+/proline symporter
LVSDLVQFAIAMIGVVAAARAALSAPQVGGLSGLVEKLDPQTLSFFPDPGNGTVFGSLLVVPLAVQWWAVWYPGSEPGGGSYIAQRMLAARNENHALAAVLWFNVAHYALRPWPWIVVALASMLVFPELADIRSALPHVDPDLLGNDIAYPAMLTLLPHGLLGLLVASLTSAYVSTLSTHLNWGASYLVNDLYRRFVRPDAGERHLVRVSRITTVGLMCGVVGFTLLLETAGEAFRLLLSFGAGTGLIYLLRWYWWRINAWSEISAMVVSFLVTMTIHLLERTGAIDLSPDAALLWTVGVTTVTWLVVTWLTPSVDRGVLEAFVRRIRPAGPGWRAFTTEGAAPADSLPQALLSWSLACLAVYAAMFATGSFLYGRSGRALFLGAVAVASGMVLGLMWRRNKGQA